MEMFNRLLQGKERLLRGTGSYSAALKRWQAGRVQMF